MNDLVEQILRSYMVFRPEDWDKRLTIAKCAINNSVNVSTRYTPFYFNYGYHLDSLLDIVVGVKENKNQSVSEWIQQMEDDFSNAMDSLSSAQERQKKYADEHRREQEFNEGDKVMLSIGKGKKAFLTGPGIQPDAKFRQKFVGPFIIQSKVSRNAYMLELPRPWAAHPVFHISRLKAWQGGSRVRQNILATHQRAIRPSEDVYEVQKIFDTRLNHGKR